jgi:acyl carrier protein
LNKTEILKKVQEIFIDVLEDENIILSYNTTSNDIKDWDSLNHIVLIVEIEKEFNFKFKLEEMQSFKNIGVLCDTILVTIN